MNELRSEDAFWLGIVGIIVMLTWSYDLERALRSLMSKTAPFAHYTNARAIFRSSGIMVGLLRITVGSFARAFPTVGWLQAVQDFTAPIITLFLLSGGVVMIVLWKLEDRERPEDSG